MAYIEKVKVTSSSITVRVAGLDTGYSYPYRYAVFYLNGSITKYVEIGAGVSRSGSVSFTGLSAETEYTFECTIFNIYNGSAYTDNKTLDAKKFSTGAKENEIGTPVIGWYKKRTSNGFKLTAYLYNLSLRYYDNDRTITFAVYRKGNLNAVETKSIPLSATVDESGDCVFSAELSLETNYVLGASIYANGRLLYDVDTVNVYVDLPSPRVVNAERHSDPRYADITIYNGGNFSNFFVISQYYDMEWGDYITQDVYEITSALTGEIKLPGVSLYHFGKSRVGFSVDRQTILDDYDIYYFDAISIADSIDDGLVEFGNNVEWKISKLISHESEDVLVYYDINGVEQGYDGLSGGSELSEVTLYITPDDEHYGGNITLQARIYDNWCLTHIITRSYYVPALATMAAAVSRDETNPENVYMSVWVNANAPIQKIRVRSSLDGSTYQDLEIRNNPSGYPVNFTFYSMGTEKRYFQVDIYYSQYGYKRLTAFLDEHSTARVDPWSWEKSNGTASMVQTINAHNAINLKLGVSDFSYLVWNDLVEKAREAYRVKNGGENTVYEGYLNAALMDNTDAGRVLTATRFNNVRKVVGGVLSTFNVNDNSIYNHYKNTGNWDMQTGEQVLGEYILALASKLNEGIEEG